MPEVVGVSGLTELRETLLKKLPEALQGKASQRALARAARPIVEMAKSLAPSRAPRGFVGPVRPGQQGANDAPPGTLKRSIYSFRNSESTKTYESRLIGVRSKAWYWRLVEFGRAAISSSKSLGTATKGWFGKVVKAVPARPFMRPAFEAKKFEALAIYQKELEPAIKKVSDQARRQSIKRITKKITGF